MPLRLLLATALSLMVLPLMAGCEFIMGPSEGREVGIILGLATQSPEIEMPLTVQAGEDFTVTIVTGWNNGCARKGMTEVKEEGSAAATVTPYDVVSTGGLCTLEPRTFTHTATLRFSEPGPAQVTIRGRTSRDSGVISVQRELTVQ